MRQLVYIRLKKEKKRYIFDIRWKSIMNINIMNNDNRNIPRPIKHKLWIIMEINDALIIFEKWCECSDLIRLPWKQRHENLLPSVYRRDQRACDARRWRVWGQNVIPFPWQLHYSCFVLLLGGGSIPLSNRLTCRA